jgi:phosphoglycerate dehydrogenase-like enzyme
VTFIFETGPMPKDSPLLALGNVRLTRHWMCSTRQACGPGFGRTAEARHPKRG